ncbi:hypothetical protein NA57DRAFT_80267 [Rhizodiscina lignyota]|uniref:BTB domain-containing protein n=1 Tax=Rhizodiscina lignyota TaxID=1504668 RepID=A0A9P4I8P2_9PEZI|nr:hypothetical protein NA57DRAFT_80267 [Rhizodiscina lignyota]
MSFAVLPEFSVLMAKRGMESYFDNGKHSDVVIRCQWKVFKLHKIVLCSGSKFFQKALEGPFKESHANEIDLSHHDPLLMNQMLRFMYVGNYELPSRPQVSHVGYHAAMYALGDEYDIQTLQDLALTHYEGALLRRRFNMGELLGIVPSICELLPIEKTALRKPLVQRVAQDMSFVHSLTIDTIACAEFMFKQTLDICPEFASDVALFANRRFYTVRIMLHRGGEAPCGVCGWSADETRQESRAIEAGAECVECLVNLVQEDWDEFLKSKKKALNLEDVDDDDLPPFEDWLEYSKTQDEAYDEFKLAYEEAKLADDKIKLVDEKLKLVNDKVKLVNGKVKLADDSLPFFNTRQDHQSVFTWAGSSSSTSDHKLSVRSGDDTAGPPRGSGRGHEEGRGQSASSTTKKTGTSWIHDMLYGLAQEDLPTVDGNVPFYYGMFQNHQGGRLRKPCGQTRAGAWSARMRG